MMVTLATENGGTWYRPGERVRGSVAWRLEGAPEALELRLFWFTSGKGTRDVEVVASHRIESPGSGGSRSFELAVPRGPYSFSGRLITLSWAVEAVALPNGETARLDLVIGPRPVEVALG
jgi:hypothetical protein